MHMKYLREIQDESRIKILDVNRQSLPEKLINTSGNYFKKLYYSFKDFGVNCI